MTFDIQQESIAVVGETEFFIFDLGTVVEYYTTRRKAVTTDVFTGSTQTFLPIPARRVGLSKEQKPVPDKTKLVMPVRPSFVSLVSQGGLDAIKVTIIRGFGTNYAVNYANPWWSGLLVDLNVGINAMEGNLHSLETLFEDTFPKVFHQPGCNNALFDDVCGVDPALWTVSRNVLDIQEGGRLVSIDDGGSPIPANDFYTKGAIRRPTDVPWRNIRQQAGLDLVLHAPILGLEVGDEVLVRAGCLKRVVLDCVEKFGNKDNNVSMALVPQNDPVIEGV